MYKCSVGSIEALTRINWTTWNQNLCRILMTKNLWRIVNGTYVRPEDPAPNAVDFDETIKQQKEWDNANNEAGGIIFLASTEQK